MKVFAIAMVALAWFAALAPATAQEFYYEYGSSARPFDPMWPPDGEPWHELYPQFCESVQQTEHDDANGDGFIDPCEHIWIDGERHHVEWVGPTYVLERPDTREEIYLEDATPTGRPTTYHEVAPVFCTAVVTEEPIGEACSNVIIIDPPEHAGEWHVKEVNTDIRTTGDPLNPVDEGTWGRIKAWFGRLLG